MRRRRRLLAAACAVALALTLAGPGEMRAAADPTVPPLDVPDDIDLEELSLTHWEGAQTSDRYGRIVAILDTDAEAPVDVFMKFQVLDASGAVLADGGSSADIRVMGESHLVVNFTAEVAENASPTRFVIWVDSVGAAPSPDTRLTLGTPSLRSEDGRPVLTGSYSYTGDGVWIPGLKAACVDGDDIVAQGGMPLGADAAREGTYEIRLTDAPAGLVDDPGVICRVSA